MDYKDIEEKLKADAQKLEQKDFSARWNEIQARATSDDFSEKKEYAWAVLASAGQISEKSTTFRINKKSPLFISIIVLAVSIILILSIVLPIVLTRNTEIIYFDEEQLTSSFVDEEDFYSGIANSNINLIDLSEYDIEGHRLYFADSVKVKGGAFELSDDNLGCYAFISFYDRSVKVNDDVSNQYEICKVNGTNVYYTIEQNDVLYSLFATTVFKNVYYRVKCTMVDDDVSKLFGQLLK